MTKKKNRSSGWAEDPRPMRTYGWSNRNDLLEARRPRCTVTGRGYDLNDAFEKLTPAKQKKAAACLHVREIEIDGDANDRHIKFLISTDDLAAVRRLSKAYALGLSSLLRAFVRHAAHDPVLKDHLARIAGTPGIHVRAS